MYRTKPVLMKRVFIFFLFTIAVVYESQAQFTRYLVKLKNKGGTPFTFANPLAYIFGTATDSIKINLSPLDTFYTKKITISNKSKFAAYLNGIDIQPAYYRIFELKNGQWTYYNGLNTAFKNDPYIDDLPFGSTNYSIEKYAKNVGLVFKELTMWDYQPNNGGQKRGFGIKMWMIDHN